MAKKKKRDGLFKEPWLAANLSLLLPGLGQLYTSAWVAGGIYLGIAAVLLGTAGLLHLLGALPWFVAVPIAMGLAGVWIASIPDAHRRARELNTPIMEQQRKRTRDPYLSALLGRFVPGAGHLYCGQLGIASGVLLGTIALAAGFAILGWAWVFFAVYPAYAAGVCMLSWLAGPEERRNSVAGILVLGAAVAASGLVVHVAVLLTHRRIEAERLLYQRMAAREDGTGSPAAIGDAPWTEE
jgi:signal peptidase I